MSGLSPLSPAFHCLEMEVGDEVITINDVILAKVEQFSDIVGLVKENDKVLRVKIRKMVREVGLTQG